ncbi:MAG TPA: hypothetical protein VNJ46_04885 [Gaiellaceae bacterium]|nr:hypothetical protein [Gaiellaceae bacterium]
MSASILPELRDDRKIEAQRLAGRGRRDKYDVFPFLNCLDGLRLVLVKRLDSFRLARVDERRVKTGRKFVCVRGRERVHCSNPTEVFLAEDISLTKDV